MIKRPSSVQKPANTGKSAPQSRPNTAPGIKSKSESRPNSLKLQSEKQSGSGNTSSKSADVKKRRPTRIPSPTKSPPGTGIRTSASTSRVQQSNRGIQAPSSRPKINSASSRLQQNSNATRLKNSGSTSKLRNPSKLKTSTSSSRLQDSDVSDCSRSNSPVKHSGKAIKTPRRPSAGFCGRSTSMADLNKASADSGSVAKPNLSKLQSLSKSTSSVNEKSVRQARREAAQRRAAEIARSRDHDGLEGVQEISPGVTGMEGRMKFLYGGHRSDSKA